MNLRSARMASFLTTALHNGSIWLLVACLMVFVGVVLGLYTRSGTGMPADTTGREEIEPLLWPRRAGRRPGRGRS
jgi:hypothetical protein